MAVKREKLLALWICNTMGFGVKKMQRILAHFGGYEEAFEAREREYEAIPYITSKDRKNLFRRKNISFLEEEWENLQKKGVHFTYYGEKEYPSSLKHITDPPYGIFYKGHLPKENAPSIAVVGARNGSYEGRTLAHKFGKELGQYGILVISGMAKGVDIAAQRGAMEEKCGKTYGVLGCGVDICYPRQHINEYTRMQEQGGILSEFPMGTPPMPYHFPMRNRLICGLAQGVLIIEAKKGSGSLITAELGLEQGKEIFVLPGSIANPLYEGGNALLQNGACLVTKTQDILDGMGMFFDENAMDRKKKSKDMLETAEKIVYAILSLEPIHLWEIADRSGFEIEKVMEILFLLQRKNCVETVGNNYYTIKL